ncbi:polynucleotidyl transferase [Ralstonia insidiosa]|uniref:polynucleotidyl transferase n=1 Tax=Ralstonia insidiosa TaxID=190721 RepID=UPI001FC98F2A|nr:polynucleotidyl transferase [Ralstonia insidiosa]
MREQKQAAWPFPSKRKHVERAQLKTVIDLLGGTEKPEVAPAELGTQRAMPAANCNVMALDLGTQCGWAVATREGKFVSGSDRFDPARCGAPGKRWLSFREFLTARAREAGGIQAVYYEEVMAHGTKDRPNTIAAHVYGGFLAILESWAAANNIPLYGVGVGTIKKHATANGRATKEDMVAAAQALGVHVIDDNHADAIALLAYALEQEA